jgi:hypothetical protein
MPNAPHRRRMGGAKEEGGDVSEPAFASAEIGDVDNLTVAVTFNEAVNSPGADYTLGVVIREGGTPQTITGGTRQSDERVVHYTLSAPITLEDSVTFEYSAASGDIEDQAGNPLGNVLSQIVTNSVGGHYRFDIPDNSGHMIGIF